MFLGDTLGPIVMLTLFVVSAAVTSSLVFMRPIILFLDKKRKEALIFLSATILWLILAIVATFLIFACL
jgi:hypothetical protein